ncbi:MAG: hypothetical protein PUE12_17740 [Oscillospiraceae bacterium]|nr:hypothetical protein [Oscillospiraceae bacterium]
MIYTSYFAQLNKLPNNIIPISICAKTPDWYKGLQYKKLAPKYDFFMEWKKNHDNDYYIKCYNEQVLDKLHPASVYTDLWNLCDNTTLTEPTICLVCYEKPSDFCHRHLVAKWLTENGCPCEEYKF